MNWPMGIPDLFSWYETSLSSRERKRRGHFSTPLWLVEQVLDACGYTPEHNLAQLRVLDPACGSGNFLVGATRRLMKFSQTQPEPTSRRGFPYDHMSQREFPYEHTSQREYPHEHTSRREYPHEHTSRREYPHEHTSHQGYPQGVPLPWTDLVARNIWGFDPDPVACFLAEMQLRGILEERFPEVVSCDDHVPEDMSLNVEPLLPTKASRLPLHIHQADALALSWEPCVDLFIGNPPYLAAKNNDLSGYQSALQRGQADSYLLFLDVALRAVRPNGWIGLVLPDPLLARANAAQERMRLLKEVTLHHLWHLAGVFAAEVGAVVLIAQKRPPTALHQVSWKRARGYSSLSPLPPDSSQFQPFRSQIQTIPQSLLSRQPGAELRYLLGEATAMSAAIARLQACLDTFSDSSASHSRLAPLSNFLSIRRGEELGRNHASLIEIERGDHPNRGFFVPDKDAHLQISGQEPAFYPVLRGGVDVQPYASPLASWQIAREAIRKPLERYLTPKLLVVKSTARLQATLDMQGHVVLQTLYLLHLHAEQSNRHAEAREDELYFFLALLNSRLLWHYIYILHTAYKWVQPQIDQHVLAHLPIPLATPHEKQEIVERARLLMRVCSQAGPVVEWNEPLKSLYEEQECAIRVLYDGVLPGLFGFADKEP